MSEPEPGDGYVDLPSFGEEQMADVSDDCLELLLDEELGAMDDMMVEHIGNAESADNIVRHSGARKFNQEDPIEAAAADMILQQNG